MNILCIVFLLQIVYSLPKNLSSPTVSSSTNETGNRSQDAAVLNSGQHQRVVDPASVGTQTPVHDAIRDKMQHLQRRILLNVDAAEDEENDETLDDDLELAARTWDDNGESDDDAKGPKVWDHWGKWSACSVSCGIGKITRWRHCVSGGCATGEKEAQIRTCTYPAC